MVAVKKGAPLLEQQTDAADQSVVQTLRDRVDVRKLPEHVALEEMALRFEPLPSCVELELSALRDGRLRLKQPLPTKIVRDETGVVAQLEAIHEYGQGASLADAVEDL